MKVVPEDVLTAPLEGLASGPQSTAVGRCDHHYFQPTIANSRGQLNVGATPDHIPLA